MRKAKALFENGTKVCHAYYFIFFQNNVANLKELEENLRKLEKDDKDWQEKEKEMNKKERVRCFFTFIECSSCVH